MLASLLPWKAMGMKTTSAPTRTIDRQNLSAVRNGEDGRDGEDEAAVAKSSPGPRLELLPSPSAILPANAVKRSRKKVRRIL